MRLCIPTLCNHAGVDELVRSAERGTVRPTGYSVIDNGGGYTLERLRALVGDRGVPCGVYCPSQNLGVAASWNLFLRRHIDEPIVISNDDIGLGPTAFAELIEHSKTHPIAGFG